MCISMNYNKDKTIESEEENIPDGDGFVSSGIFGDTDTVAMADRKKREDFYKSRYHYREQIPCEYCSHCLELRKFSREGLAMTTGFYCFHAEMAVCRNGTCDNAHERPNGRKRIIYDKANAPAGFEKGLAPVLPKRYYTKRERERETKFALRMDGYRGGSSGYQRIDGDGEAAMSGRLPKGLGN